MQETFQRPVGATLDPQAMRHETCANCLTLLFDTSSSSKNCPATAEASSSCIEGSIIRLVKGHGGREVKMGWKKEGEDYL